MRNTDFPGIIPVISIRSGNIVRLPLKVVSVTYRGNVGYYRGKIHPFGLDSGFPFDYRGNLKMKLLKRVISQRGLNVLFG